MFPFSPFAHPTGSFPLPVPPPVSTGGLCSTLSVQFPSEWLPYIIGALQQLTLQSTWQGTRDEIIATQQQAAAIIGNIQHAICVTAPAEMSGINCDGDCDMCCLRWQDGVLQVFSCGVWTDVPGGGPSGNAQPGAGSLLPPPNGGSQQYCFALGPRETVLAPAVVNSGDTILISGVKGAWNDSNSLYWYCPSGWQFILGGCNPTAIVNMGQLLVTSRYMGIIAQIGSGYFDVFNPDAQGNPQLFTVPSGIVNQQVLFLANFTPASPALGAGGAVDFCATITNNEAGTWTHEFDFSLSDWGWIPDNVGAGDLAVYVPGQGWGSVTGIGSPNFTDLDVKSPSVSARTYTRVEVFYSTDSDNGSSGSREVLTNPGAVVFGALSSGSGMFDTVLTGSASGATQLNINIDRDTPPTSGNYRLTKVIITGQGTDPF